MKIALLIVENREQILLKYAQFLLKLAFSNKVFLFQFCHLPKRKAIWYMRREMIKETLKNKEVTHILQIDTDVIPPNDFLERLIAHDKDIVSGVYHGLRGEPCSVKDGKVYQGEGLEEVDTFSMGLSLMSRKVLEEIEYPEPNPTSKIDGDSEFCKLAREKGYTIYQDFSLRGSHLLLGRY